MNDATVASAIPLESAEVLNSPLKDLMSRYRAVFKSAWDHRAELAGPTRMADEKAFLPAALSLQETPVHPAPRRAAYVLMTLFAIALVWSIVGEVDIVAVAPGRIVVSDGTKVIQPLEASVVKAVLVKDGDRVKAGQVLIELDPTIANADKASVKEQLEATISEETRTTGLLSLLSNQKQLSQVQRELQPELRMQLLSEWLDIGAKLSKLDAEYMRRHAEMATVRETIAKLETTVPIARSREVDFKKLVDQGYISGHATQDKTRERIELELDLSIQRARMAEAQASLKESEQSKTSYRAETQRALQDRHAIALTKHQQLNTDQTKAEQRERLTQLTAPVAGVVQQLAVHTTGGVVTSAQPLMIVVPDTATVTAEVSVANQDIGFVNTGQTAEIKLETFSYSKYGTVDAKVDNVTADAVTDEKLGSFFPATLTLSKRAMSIDGKLIALSPGMNVTAEIKTGKRRIIEYLLSPIQKASSESLRER